MKEERPPLGLMPKRIWDLERIEEIDAAIGRYKLVGKTIPVEWIVERQNLLRELPEGFIQRM